MEGIGTLLPVDVREVWADEARDFTLWLAENSDLLGEALGLDLIHEQTEAAVGRYSADLVFREESSDRLVVVENLFGSTDHDHLGKLITYAAGLEAGYAVLLTPEFRDEHRSASTGFLITYQAHLVSQSVPYSCNELKDRGRRWHAIEFSFRRLQPDAVHGRVRDGGEVHRGGVSLALAERVRLPPM